MRVALNNFVIVKNRKIDEICGRSKPGDLNSTEEIQDMLLQELVSTADWSYKNGTSCNSTKLNYETY